MIRHDSSMIHLELGEFEDVWPRDEFIDYDRFIYSFIDILSMFIPTVEMQGTFLGLFQWNKPLRCGCSIDSMEAVFFPPHHIHIDQCHYTSTGVSMC